MVRSADSADWGICGSMRRSLFFGIRRWRPMLKLRFAGLRKGASEPEGTSISAFRRARSGAGIPMVSGRCTIYGKIYTIYENNQRSEKNKKSSLFLSICCCFCDIRNNQSVRRAGFRVESVRWFRGRGLPAVPCRAGSPGRHSGPRLHAEVQNQIARERPTIHPSEEPSVGKPFRIGRMRQPAKAGALRR